MSLKISYLRRNPRAWCLLLRVPACYTQDCILLTPATPKQKKSVFCVMNMLSCTLKNGMFRPEKPAFSPRNMPCFKTQNPPNPASPLAPPPFSFRLRSLGVGGCHHFSFLRVAPARASTQKGRFRCVLENNYFQIFWKLDNLFLFLHRKKICRWVSWLF